MIRSIFAFSVRDMACLTPDGSREMPNLRDVRASTVPRGFGNGCHHLRSGLSGLTDAVGPAVRLGGRDIGRSPGRERVLASINSPRGLGFLPVPDAGVQ